MKERIKKDLIAIYTCIFFSLMSFYTASWGLSNFSVHRPNKIWFEPGRNFYFSKEFFIIVLLILFSSLAFSNLVSFFINKKLFKKMFFVLLCYGFLCNILWALTYIRFESGFLEELMPFLITITIWIVAMGSVYIINKKKIYNNSFQQT